MSETSASGRETRQLLSRCSSSRAGCSRDTGTLARERWVRSRQVAGPLVQGSSWQGENIPTST